MDVKHWPQDESRKNNLRSSPHRVVVLGTAGSGKSTLATRLAALINAEHVELDSLYHRPNWTPAPIDEFRTTVAEVIRQPRWVIDGNYIDRMAESVWPQAEMIVWLDLPLNVVLPRLVRRTLRRIVFRTQLWAGNRETWAALFGRNSLLGWAINWHRLHRSEYPSRLSALSRSGIRVVRLRSAKAVNNWLTQQVQNRT